MAENMTTTQAAPLARPSYIPESNKGREDIKLKDMVLPRLTLCQNNSHARDKNHKKYIKGLEEGQLFNSLTGHIYGEDIQIVPLFFYRSRIMFKDMKEGGGIICQAPDGAHCQLNHGGACLHQAWGPGGEPPECSEFFNYPSLVYQGPGDKTQELIIVSLKTTGLAAGRTMNSLMRMRNAASYAGIYRLFSFPTKNKGGIGYYGWDVRNAEIDGQAMWTDPDLYKRAEEMFEGVKAGLTSGAIKVDDSEDAFADRDSEV